METVWPPSRPGFLDVFSGERGVALALVKKGHWSLCVDLAHGPNEDVMDPVLQSQLELLVGLGVFYGAGGGPVCTSFSTAITPPVRSTAAPYGLETVSDKMRVKIEEGNRMAIWFFSFLEYCLERKLRIWMENPATSFMFRLPEWQSLLQRWPSVQAWLVDYCRYGTRWRKRTKFYTDGPLGGRRDLCRCGKPHQLLRGRSAMHKKSWTAVAQPYPLGVCEELAVNLLAGLQNGVEKPRAGRPSDAAFAGKGRIGEASNPGPRRAAGSRSGYLDDVALVEPKTLAIQTRVWNDFADWLNSQLSAAAVESVMKHFGLLAQVLKEYGCHLYGEGRSPLCVSPLSGLHSAILCGSKAVLAELLGPHYKVGNRGAFYSQSSDPRGCCKGYHLMCNPMGLASVCQRGRYLVLRNISSRRTSQS